MKSDLDNWYLKHAEPAKSCLLALRTIFLQYDPEIMEAWKYRMPFFCYKKKMIFYLWVNKKTGQPYIGFVDGNKIDHPKLVAEKRSRMKVLMIDVQRDLPVKTIHTLVMLSIDLRLQTISKS